MNIDYSTCEFHAGEIEVQRQAGVSELSKRLHSLIKPFLTPAEIRFIQAQNFLFMATANASGDCDCSFKGSSFNKDGSLQPLLAVVSPFQIVMPDFSGNNLFNSLGNITLNPKVGLLFVDFERQARFRVNGRVRISDVPGDHAQIWPKAKRILFIDIEQAYPNCSARVPHLVARD